MYCTKNITDDLVWIGANDRHLSLFENVYPIEKGVSYNSYLLKDDKTVLFDTVDKAVSIQFFENLEHELGGRSLDYIIVNHMEPDHAATLQDVVNKYPEAKIVCNLKTQTMIKQFFDFDIESKAQIIKEGDTLNTGRHTFTFVMAPMVHWPEAMVTYDLTDKTLFSADAFGTFGAMSGNIFADEVNFETEWLDEARRYYTNIVGKYGMQVQALLKKAATLEIKTICALHGPVWRKNINWFIDKYQKWSTYTPEINSVLILSGSIYGHTENTAEIFASKLADKGIKDIKLYDVSRVHPSVLVAEAFKYSHIVIASSTYNAGIFTPMETVLLDIKAHNLQNRTFGIMYNGTWAPVSEAVLKAPIENIKNTTILNKVVKITSALKSSQDSELDELVEEICSTMPKAKTDTNAMFKINYGLFVLAANNDGKDSACIINTVNQVSANPNRIAFAVNKDNYTKEQIEKSGKVAISVLTKETPFSVFKNFGYQSGRDVDKFKDFDKVERCENGVLALTDYTSAVICAKVVSSQDCGTHTLFVADVESAKVVSDAEPVTYNYYLTNIKPAPAVTAEKKKGYICKICGYVYEGDVLPDDFICPLCKHGAADFEKIV
ncbi:MAG: flavin reductase [Candidatus Gastranaerophilales bacterium]|nr:flavin reductase [Candidatus Gastranaerophilales bacterium]